MTDDLFLGLDCSTQSMKALIIDSQKRIQFQASVNFDADLPSYKTSGGVIRGMTLEEEAKNKAEGKQTLVVTAPSLMFVSALDLILQRLQDQKVPFSKISGISGSGQQHASVYWSLGARKILSSLSPDASLAEQLQKGKVFSLPNGPIWMDSSTTKQCQDLEKALKGAQAVADISGSRAYERFTGNQIAKVAQEYPSAYQATERISLVSSLVASLFIGDYAPIDQSDGSGMNLMNIKTKDWDERLLAATVPSSPGGDSKTLRQKLGPIVGEEIVGTIHSYFIKKYGFNSKCKVVACSGDNPCTLIGMELREEGDVGVSLGTSDTLFAVVSNPRPSGKEGHVLINPSDSKTAMLMLCFKNGSLTREHIRDKAAGKSWTKFTSSLNTSIPGNNGQIGIYWLEPEITPTTLKPGFYRFDAQDQKKSSFTPDAEIRAIVEGQFLSLRHHAQSLGLTSPKRIVATGGGSLNAALLQVLADVFQAPVYTQQLTGGSGDSNAMSNTAALGAAYRALYGVLGKSEDYQARKTPTSSGSAVVLIEAAKPNKESASVYSSLLRRYAKLESKALEWNSSELPSKL